jgi:hypothetical protein|tara:strand:- start:904 stop:1362 length:459 start_codon:yes stop_codon:yes gene_type:complete
MSLTQVIGSGLGSLGTSLVATADGGSATTSVIQGLTKHFTMYNQDANTVKESFNQSSITDNSTGDFTTSFTNNFNNTVYCSVGMAENQYTTARGQNGLCIDTQLNSSDAVSNGTALSASARDYRTKFGSNSSESGGYSDQAPGMLANVGDLA